MNKRGSFPYRYLLGSIVGIFILVSFIYAGNAFGSQKAYYKSSVARDLALTIDLVYGLQGNIEFKYPNDVSDYGIEINDKVIRVYDKRAGNLDPTAATYNFAGIAKDDLNSNIQGSKFVKITKTGSKITVMGVDS